MELIIEDTYIFSLEEEDGSELFLTQQSRSNNEVEESEGNCESTWFGMDPLDFTSPCVSLVGGGNPVYSDNSDSEDFVGDQPKFGDTR